MKKRHEVFLKPNPHSLRNFVRNLKENDLHYEDKQITQCVFLGVLRLKPVPTMFSTKNKSLQHQENTIELVSIVDSTPKEVPSSNKVVNPVEVLFNKLKQQTKQVPCDIVPSQTSTSSSSKEPQRKEKRRESQKNAIEIPKKLTRGQLKRILETKRSRKEEQNNKQKHYKTLLPPKRRKFSIFEKSRTMYFLDDKPKVNPQEEVSNNNLPKPEISNKRSRSPTMIFGDTTLPTISLKEEEDSDNFVVPPKEELEVIPLEEDCLSNKSEENPKETLKDPLSVEDNEEIEETVAGELDKNKVLVCYNTPKIIDVVVIHSSDSNAKEEKRKLAQTSILLPPQNDTSPEQSPLEEDLSDSMNNSIESAELTTSDCSSQKEQISYDYDEMEDDSDDGSKVEWMPEDYAEYKFNYSVKKMKFKRIFKCKICLMVFASYYRLNRHKELQHVKNDHPYSCNDCDKTFALLDELTAHIREHKGKQPYTCKKCNKGFWSKKALDGHIPVHILRKVKTTNKRFRCEVCNKEFTKLCDMERHTRVHTGEKPCVCNICNKRFQQSHNLSKHLLTHLHLKPFHCEICDKQFGRNDVLNRHLLTHSIDKPFKCVDCQKTFIRESQLNHHRNKHHVTKP